MAFSLFPNLYRSGFAQLCPEELSAAGIRLVLADLDNTLAPYGVLEPSTRLRQWKRDLEEHGIVLFVVSNSRRPTRVKDFCARLDVAFVGHAGKPGAGGFQTAMDQTGIPTDETLMIGDQIFTDILGGNRAGVTTVLVHPIAFGTVFRVLRFAIETPFRLLCKNKGGAFRKGDSK